MPAASDGAYQLRALGVRMRALGAAGALSAAPSLGAEFGGGKSLRAQLLAGIRAGAKPAVEATREAARDTLPKKGGLNSYVADTAITVSTRLTGSRVGVRIGTPRGQKKSGQVFGANKGKLRHPVFGHKDRWADQTLSSSGWFDSTLRREAPKVIVPIRAAMEAVANEATRRGF